MGRPRIVLGGVALLILAPLVVAAQGLGDASKKEKARREQSKAPKAKTYTQDELSSLPPLANEPATSTGESTPAASAPRPSAGEPAPQDTTAEPTVPDRSPGAGESARPTEENVWRGSVAQATARVERARRSYQTLAGMNLVPGYEYQDAKGRTVISSVEELQRMTAAAKAELDAAEKALADLLERARRAGIPPGWLR
jgi:hypothetical protein